MFPFCLQVDLVVSFLDDSALAGRGGEEGVVWNWCGVAGGGPARRRAGWKIGGSGERVLWPFAFNACQIRRTASADSLCGRLLVVVVLPSRRRVVRRRRHCVGVWDAVWDPSVSLPEAEGALCTCSGSSCNFRFLLDFLVSVLSFLYINVRSSSKKKNS